MHEGLYYYPEYQNFMQSDQAGDSTTCYIKVKDFIQNERKIIIHRDIDAVKRSLLKVFGVCEFDFLEESQELLNIEDGLHIQYR